MLKSLTTLFLLCLPFACLFSQPEDSLVLDPKKLGISDIIKPVEDDKSKIKIISGSRFPIAAGELPFSTYIITKEEIRQNAYETLVDALKMAPGIFTSQPGSARDGETFLMRGLLGNDYTKILINDIPIKPAFLPGMPIGAQLPIREAERIEVIYGAGAALYGADASAGVINIITRKSDRPVYMQADLSVGVGEYSSANVMFGGKWGRDKNILHYFAYGSNVLYEDRHVIRNFDQGYNTDNYPWLTLNSDAFKSLPNYQEEPWGGPQINNTPHLSRKFGLQFKFRRLTLSMETMARRDHSAIGLSPVAVSYANPLTYSGENIARFNLNMYREKENNNRKTDLTYIRYRQDENSSISNIQPRLAVELFRLARVQAANVDPNNVDALQRSFYQTSYNKYLSNNRFKYGLTDEIRLEHVQNYRILRNSSITFGGNIKWTYGVPSTEFLMRPPNDDCSNFFASPCAEFLADTTTFPITPRVWNSGEANLFGQWFYEGRKFNFAFGFNYSSYGDSELNTTGDVFLPRIAGLYKITEELNVRSSWGRSYRTPNVYYVTNTYNISSEEDDALSINYSDKLEAETTTSWESGIRFLSGKDVDFDFTYFVSETKNLINYGLRVFENEELSYISRLGYANATGSTIKYRGGNVMTNIGFGDKLDGTYTYSWTKSKLDAVGFTENYFLPQYSGRIHQFRLIYRPLKTTTIIMDYRRVKSENTAANSIEAGTIKFATIDLVGRYSFNDRFDTYFKIINLTNKEYTGIAATRTPDDANVNPQFGSFFKLGMNYYIE